MNQKGLSLIELMLVALISVVMMGGLFQMFFSNLMAANYHENRSLARERAQHALFLLTHDVREAGSGSGLVGPGSYNIFYNSRFSGATDSTSTAGMTLDECQLQCDTASNCSGISWANKYVIDGLPGFAPSMSISCLNGFAGHAGGGGGSTNPVEVVLQPLFIATKRLEQAKTDFDATMSTPPTADEQTKSDQIGNLKDSFQQEYDSLQTTFTSNYNSNPGGFDSVSASSQVSTFMAGKKDNLDALGLDITGGDVTDNTVTGGNCINSSSSPGGNAIKTGSCWMQTGGGAPSRVSKGGWITYQHIENTLFYSGTCGGSTCTANGSGNSSDAIAVVLDPASNTDCTGNSVASGDTTVNRYFIKADSDGNNGLYCQGFDPDNGSSNGSEQLMVSGIENMQVLYGYADKGGHAVTSYRLPGDISNWMYVRSVHIGILAGGEKLWGPGTHRQRSYSFMGVNNLQITDGKERFVFTTLQRLNATRDDYSWRDRLIYENE
ncbi:PilW family protein [Endozoicomonas sp. Mp262]|uniref:PilW family protein n=1 Tax=Endozoicomonas sp. Mp262 TaxID=2919499 RepID=UPI0021DA1D26